MKNDYRIKSINNVTGNVQDFFCWLTEVELSEQVNYLLSNHCTILLLQKLFN